MPTYQSKADLEALFLETSAELYQYALRMTADGSLSDDMVQTVFVNLVRFLPIEMSKPRPFLFCSIRNAIVDWMRRRACLDVDQLEEEACPGKDETEVRDLRDAVRALPRTRSEIVFLLYWGELTEAEVAKQLDMSERDVRVNYLAALSFLRKQYSDLPEETHAEQRT